MLSPKRIQLSFLWVNKFPPFPNVRRSKLWQSLHICGYINYGSNSVMCQQIFYSSIGQAVVVDVYGFLLPLHISYLPWCQPEPLLVLALYMVEWPKLSILNSLSPINLLVSVSFSLRYQYYAWEYWRVSRESHEFFKTFFLQNLMMIHCAWTIIPASHTSC